jgi:hypothetical protein
MSERSATSVRSQAADVFGYTAVFEEELRRAGTLTPEELAACFPAPDYLPSVSCDPTQARFFGDFDRDLGLWYEGQLCRLLNERLDWEHLAIPVERSPLLARVVEMLGAARQALTDYHQELAQRRKEAQTDWPNELWERYQQLAAEARQATAPEPLLHLLCCCCGFNLQRLQALQQSSLRSTGNLVGWFDNQELERWLNLEGERCAEIRTAGIWTNEDLVRWLRLPERMHLYHWLTGKGGFYYNFRLAPAERELFARNGFVVSERMGSASFGELFYRLYSHDLPIFVSADAVLHAWQRSYEAILEELEEGFLHASLEEILTGLAERLLEAQSEYGDGVLAESLADADYFLAVARSLLTGHTVAGTLGQEERIDETLRACAAGEAQQFVLFDRMRMVDFSQFKPRGRYEHSVLLRRYFQAMMWCGRIDLRIAGDPQESSPRELGAALVLFDLLRRSGRYEQWQQFDRLLQGLCGPSDALDFAGLRALLIRAEIGSPAEVRDVATLLDLQAGLLAGSAGFQQVRGDHHFYSPFTEEHTSLPRSFAFLGQRFSLDSWALSKVVFGDVVWEGERVQRRVPSCLDVAFAVLGNDHVVPALVARMTHAGGRRFRDGLPYQHNLLAARRTVDAQGSAAWEASLHGRWLACLRALSTPATDPRQTEAVRTRAWARRTLNTQMASWTGLRHAHALHVKQSYSGGTLCEYPAGYVEPVPAFWECLAALVSAAAELIAATPFPDRTLTRKPIGDRMRTSLDRSSPEQRSELERAWGLTVNPHATQERQAAFLRRFVEKVGILGQIARKQADRLELSPDEAAFLRDVIQIDNSSGGPYYNGWYPTLFYLDPKECGRTAALVADVHTDLPDPLCSDPGCVLHEGVGAVDLLLLVADGPHGPTMYAGPVFSHYEFETPAGVRLTDTEWRKTLSAGAPARPEWTREYLVPEIRRSNP